MWLLCAQGRYLGSGGTVLGADVRFWESNGFIPGVLREIRQWFETALSLPAACSPEPRTLLGSCRPLPEQADCARHPRQHPRRDGLGCLKLARQPHQDSPASGGFLLWVAGSPGRAPGQSCALAVGPARLPARCCGSETMAQARATSNFISWGFWWGGNVGSGFVWQSRLFPDQLDLAACRS